MVMYCYGKGIKFDRSIFLYFYAKVGSEMAIKDIAKLAGVSPATVSRVLNNPDYHCQDATAVERIWKAAMELNYVPNEAARNLKKGSKTTNNKTYYVQVLLTRTEESQADPFYTEVLRVVESEIHDKGCILSNIWYMSMFSDDKRCRLANLDKIISGLYAETKEKSNGLIIIGKCNSNALRILKSYFKNVVSINRNSTNRQIDEVTCDGRKIANLAMEHLISLGHEDIGYVGETIGESRYQGFLDCLGRHELERKEHFIWDIKQSEMAGYEVMERILEQDEIPTAIYCANDITAVGMLKALSKAANRYFVLSVISSDGIEQAQGTTPMLTTVELPKIEMGRFAVYLLIDRIQRGHKSVASIELEGSLVKRESCVDVSNSRWCDYCI